MKQAFLEAAKNFQWKERAKHLIYHTPVEVVIGAVLVGGVFGTVIYNKNAEREGRIPTAFSEIERTTRDFNRLGKPVPPLTRLYSGVSDVPMKVFESNNMARSMNDKNDIFARELETRVDRSLRIFKLITEYAAEIPNDAREALLSLAKISEAAKDAPAVASAFSQSWSEDHDDVYRPESYTTESCDSNGRCTTEYHTRQVYDHTDHTYIYHREEGEKAAQVLAGFLAKHPDVNIEERLVLAKRTGADNEYAIEKSMRELLKGKIPTQAEALKYANMWATGSNFSEYLPKVVSNHAGLKQDFPAWNTAKNTAEAKYEYSTSSSSDSGPKEYQVAKSAQRHAEAIPAAEAKITNGIRFAAQGIPALESKIKEFIGVTLDGKPGDADKLRKEVMALSRDIYQKNFENGLDVQPFKWSEILLFTILGAVLGGAAGAGVDYMLNRKKLTEWFSFKGSPQDTLSPSGNEPPKPPRFPRKIEL